MREADLNKRLQTVAKGMDVKVVLHRIENSAAVGTFDTYIGSRIGQGWIELKICGPNAKPQMRPGQPGFGLMMMGACIPAHILCSSHDGDVKLLRGGCLGDDWREHLVLRAELSNTAAMQNVLKVCMGAG